MSSTHTDDDATPRPWWGTAAAATQCEGAAPGADWAGWETEGRAPASRDGNGFRTRYADDLALLAEHGITHHRLTVEWARLEPRSGRWDADEVAHLRRVLEAARGVGVEMWACLLHGSAPGWFTDDERGWLGDRAVLTWARHVDRVAEAVGDLVAGWVPIHEPEVVARLGYGDGTFPPGRHDPDDHRDARAALLAAEAEAARLLRSGPAPVGVTARPGTPEDEHDLLVVNAAVDRVEAPLEGAIEATPGTRLLVVTGDPDTGSGGGRGGTSAGGDEREPDDRRSEGSGPGGQAADEPRAVDAARAERLARAVQTITDAAAVSAGIVGTFVQPAIDGYEWHRGFEARLGLFDRDRNPRPALAALPVAGPRAEAPPSPAG